MSKTVATLALIGVTLLNLLVVGALAALGVHGDGTQGIALWVLGFGALWVGGFGTRAVARLKKGDHAGGVKLAAKAMPYAFIIGLPTMYLVMFIRMM